MKLFFEVYVGYDDKHIEGMANRGTHASHFQDITVIGDLDMKIMTMILMSSAAIKFLMDAVFELKTKGGASK